MKKVVVVAALLGAMLAVEWLQRTGSTSATNLAGMGFVMLAAYSVAELGGALSLPQVTGYILAGLVLGPSALGIISGDMVGDMRMFNTLALGLIATSAGLELDLKQIARLAKTLVLTTLIKVVAGVSLVALTLVAVESSFELLGLRKQGELATLALVLGVLSIGTSPSIALAVLSETRAKGRLSDLVLGAAVFKDLVVVVGLAIATALGRRWLSQGGSSDYSVIIRIAVELGGSIGAGSVVGLIFIVYVRFIRAEMLLFVAAMILVVAELCRTFHLELLLVFIAAGFVVRNFSPFEHDLMRPLRLVALPVFVLFFANAGASIDLLTTWTILPIALAICLTRAAVYFVASRVGGKWAGESPGIRRHAWLAYLPQAGVTLGLVGVASLQLPELAGAITSTGMAVVALNLLVGPITLRRALGVLGEIPSPIGEAATPEADSSVPASAPAHGSPSPIPLPEPLRAVHADLAGRLRRVLDRFELEVKPTLPGLPTLANELPALDEFKNIVVVHRAAYRSLHGELTQALASAPRDMLLPSPAGALRQWVSRWRKVPVRRIAHIALGPELAGLVARWFHTGLRPTSSSLESSSAAGGDRRDPRAELERGLERLDELMRDVGTRRLPAQRLRYSDVEPEVRRAIHGLNETADDDLVRLVQASWGSALLEARRTSVALALRRVIQDGVIDPAMSASAKIRPATLKLDTWIVARGAELALTSSSAELARWHSDFDALVRSDLIEPAREFRFAATVRSTLAELLASAASAPPRIDCLTLEGQAALWQGKVQSVALRAQVDALVRHLMPAIELAARSVATELNQLSRRVDDAMQLEWSSFEAQLDSRTTDVRLLVSEHASLLRQRLAQVTTSSTQAVEAAIHALSDSLGPMFESFSGNVKAGPLRQGQREAVLGRVRRAFAKLVDTVLAAFSAVQPLRDAAELRERAHARPHAPVPAEVERWFDDAPVTDEQTFAARHRLLDVMLDAEASRADTGRASVLVIGSKGAGKSSLLNMCELELPYPTQIRLHAADFARDCSLFEIMSNLLDCAPTLQALTRALAAKAPAVFVDDLPAWISVSQNRQAELERTLQLVAQTSHRALWVVSIDPAMLALLREVAPVEEVFTHVFQLPPLTLPDVKRLVEARLALLEQPIHIESRGWNTIVARLRSASDSERLYRRLWRTSLGNPARVVALCRAAFQVDGQRLVLRVDAVGEPRLPRYDFSATQLALLATLHRYGPQPVERLATELAVSAEQLWRSATFLSAAGLVHATDDGHAFSISPRASWVVFKTLVAARLATE